MKPLADPVETPLDFAFPNEEPVVQSRTGDDSKGLIIDNWMVKIKRYPFKTVCPGCGLSHVVDPANGLLVPELFPVGRSRAMMKVRAGKREKASQTEINDAEVL
jgi:hypothetical protein